MSKKAKRILRKVLLFGERKKMADRFIKWAEDNKAKICPLNVMTWLDREKKALFRSEAIDIVKCLQRKESGIFTTTEHFLIHHFGIEEDE